ncbi:MAG: four helix bundle protein [Prevotella sp.]|nr:four helix bundle protein [Prevotella sp.]
MKKTEDNLIAVKSKAFAIRIVKLYKYLCDKNKNPIIGSQLLRSGTSIGANIKEGLRAQSKPDFVSKMSIALKEASETEFWLEILRDSEYLTITQAESMLEDCVEIIRLLMSITKTAEGK